MNKRELIQAISDRTGLRQQQADAALDALLDAISDTLAEGDTVQIYGFGSFFLRQRPARRGRKPGSGEQPPCPDICIPAFNPGRNLMEAVSK